MQLTNFHFLPKGKSRLELFARQSEFRPIRIWVSCRSKTNICDRGRQIHVQNLSSILLRVHPLTGKVWFAFYPQNICTYNSKEEGRQTSVQDFYNALSCKIVKMEEKRVMSFKWEHPPKKLPASFKEKNLFPVWEWRNFSAMQCLLKKRNYLKRQQNAKGLFHLCRCCKHRT